MPETDLPQMVDTSGEVVRLTTAEDLLRAGGLAGRLDEAELDELATFDDNARHLEAIAKEARGTVAREGIRRLDRRGKWTVRESGWEIKGSSPTAGTTKYDTDRLLAAIRALLVDGTIDQEAADAALEPQHGTVAITGEQLRVLEAALAADEHETAKVNAGHALIEDLAEALPVTTYKQRPAGINALLKLGPDVVAALETAKVPVDPPDRRATFKRTDKD